MLLAIKDVYGLMLQTRMSYMFPTLLSICRPSYAMVSSRRAASRMRHAGVEVTNIRGADVSCETFWTDVMLGLCPCLVTS